MFKKRVKGTSPSVNPKSFPSGSGPVFRPPRTILPSASKSGGDLVTHSNPVSSRSSEDDEDDKYVELIDGFPDSDPWIKLFRSLNNKQKMAVASDGHVLVLAGPGSGKTRVIVGKILRLMVVDEYDPARICAVTFTNKAAAEMRSRITDIYGDRAKGLFLGTFHQLCARILRCSGSVAKIPANFFICDANDSMSLVKKVCKELSVLHVHEASYNIINSAKGLRISPTEYIKQSGRPYPQDVVNNIGNIFQEYESNLKKMGGLDFNDLLLKTVEIFESFDEIRERFARACEYLLIDEFQDTNMLQFDLCKHLSSIHKNVTAVGDPYQCIYSWRGADFTNMKRFSDFKNCKNVFLDQNYRSTTHLLKCTNAIMKGLNDRMRGSMWTDNLRGPPVSLLFVESPDSEARLIAKEILELKASNVIGFEDVAVLCRNHYMTRPIEEEFIRKGIMYRLVGGVAFYDREEIKDLLCYLRLAINPKDDFAFQRTVNTPARGMGLRTLECIEEAAKRLDIPMFDVAVKTAQGDKTQGLPTAKRRSLIIYINLLDRIGAMAAIGTSPAEILDFLIREIDFEGHLKKDMDTYQQRWENVLELKHVAGQPANYEPTEGEPKSATPLTRFMQYVGLLSGHENGEGREAVVISTLHSAKGLEWPVVFITGVESGTIPSYRSLASPNGLEEERRLFYVGSTRAKALLYWTHCRVRRVGYELKTMEVSDFVRSVPDDVIDDHPPKKTKKFLEDLAIFTGKSPHEASNSQGSTREEKAPSQSTKASKKRNLSKSPERSATSTETQAVSSTFVSARSVMQAQSAQRKTSPKGSPVGYSPTGSPRKSPVNSPTRSPVKKRRNVAREYRSRSELSDEDEVVAVLKVEDEPKVEPEVDVIDLPSHSKGKSGTRSKGNTRDAHSKGKSGTRSKGNTRDASPQTLIAGEFDIRPRVRPQSSAKSSPSPAKVNPKTHPLIIDILEDDSDEDD